MELHKINNTAFTDPIATVLWHEDGQYWTVEIITQWANIPPHGGDTVTVPPQTAQARFMIDPRDVREGVIELIWV